MIGVFILVLLAAAENPVDKLEEFQKLISHKVKVPKIAISEYDSSDIFSDGYMTEEEEEIILPVQLIEEQVIESTDDDTEELERLELERLQAIEIARQEQEEEEKRIRDEQLKLMMMEDTKKIKKDRKHKKEQKLIQIESSYEEEEEPLESYEESEIIEEIEVPKKKRTQQRKQEEAEILEIINDGAATKKKITLKDFEELEVLKASMAKQSQKKKRQPIEQPIEYDDEPVIVQEKRIKIPTEGDFIQRIPAQSEEFIHFSNPNNKLEIQPCSTNPTQQRACALCNSEQGYMLDDDNWYLIGLEHGYKKEFLMLLDSTKELLGESQLYLSFSSDNNVCLTSESLKSQLNLENVMRRFSDKSVKHFIKNDLFEIPEQLEGQSFQFRASYANKQFTFKNFEIQVGGSITNQLSNGVLIKTNTIEFIADQNLASLSGVVKQQNDELGFQLDLKDGEQYTELLVQNCSIPSHNELLNGLSDLYFGDYFKESLQSKLKNQNFKADLVATTDNSDGKFKLKFALKKK